MFRSTLWAESRLLTRHPTRVRSTESSYQGGGILAWPVLPLTPYVSCPLNFHFLRPPHCIATTVFREWGRVQMRSHFTLKFRVFCTTSLLVLTVLFYSFRTLIFFRGHCFSTSFQKIRPFPISPSLLGNFMSQAALYEVLIVLAMWNLLTPVFGAYFKLSFWNIQLAFEKFTALNLWIYKGDSKEHWNCSKRFVTPFIVKPIFHTIKFSKNHFNY